MSDNKKVDAILKEYVSEEKPSSKAADNNPSTGTSGQTNYSEQMKNAEETVLKRPVPSHQSGKFAVSDINRPNVSYINSVTEVRKTSADLPPRPTDLIEGYDGAVMTAQPPDDTYVPKVRKMSNSTRAKEMRARKRKKNRKKKLDFTYAVESPDGIYTKPEKKSKKFIIQREADELPPPVSDNGNIIPLSEQNDPNALDIRITELNMTSDKDRDYTGKKKKRKKSDKYYDKRKNVKDYDSFEDAREIRKGIAEVRESISFRVIILLITTLFSCYMAAGSLIGLPVPSMLTAENPETYCWVQLIILLLSVIMSFSTFKNGIASLFTFRADSDSLSTLAVLSSGVATAAAAVLSPDMVKNGNIYVYVPVAILGMLFNAVGKKLILSRMTMNFNYISKDRDAHAVVSVENDDRAESLTRGTIGDFPILATMKKTHFIKDFARYTYSSDTGDKYSRVLAPVSIVLSLLLAAIVTLLRVDTYDMSAIAYALFVFSAAISACSCMAIPLIANIPLEKASKKYSKNIGIMLGYQSVDDFYDTNSVMVSAESFFPIGTISLSSIKLFSGTKIDNALLEAASLTAHANSVLKELFTDIVTEKNKTLSRVENFVYEDSMGLCGWIRNRRILFGNRELMTNHKIEGIPTLTKEKEFTEGGKEALYLSVSGNLAAMFIIEISASTAVIKCMKQLEKKDMAVIVKSVDPFITINRLSQLFHYPDELIKILPQRLVNDFDEETKPARKVSASMACSGRFTSFMNLIMSTKSIRQTVTIGITLQLASALLGFILVAMNSVLNAFDTITPVMILIYQLVCTLLISLVMKFRKV